MGGGLTFLSKKSFNPQNWSNQRRVWEARQNSESEKRRIVERDAQIKREREEEELARVVGGEQEGGRKALGFMYDGGKIPGLKKESNQRNDDEDEDESKRNTSVSGDNTESNLFQRQPGDDDAAAAFRAMLAQGVTADDNTDKQLHETNQQHDVLDAQAAEDSDSNNANEATDNRTKLEKAVGRGINSGSGVTLAQQMERFPMLKGAPMVLQKQKNKGGDGEKKEQAATTTGMNFKPLGQVLRNVQCMACKKWGHARGERECELSGWDPFRMNTTAAATAATTTTTIASAAPDNMAAAEIPRVAAKAHLPDQNKMEEEPTSQKPERKKKHRKGDRHERKKKSKKHKRRRRRERSPSYSSDSYSSSYDSYSSDEERYKKRKRNYRSDDSSDSRRRSRKGRRKKSSRR